jgi:TusA-related sulfurtransferase
VGASSHEVDLRGVRCPVTWARARVRLETLERGTEVTLVVDDPLSARDVPRAAEASGHHVIGVEADGAWWRIVLEV